jgi:hypothetical protein
MWIDIDHYCSFAISIQIYISKPQTMVHQRPYGCNPQKKWRGSEGSSSSNLGSSLKVETKVRISPNTNEDKMVFG